MFSNWLRPLSDEIRQIIPTLSKGSFGKRITVYTDSFPDLVGVKIALIGIGSDTAANETRKALYALHFPFRRLVVADLGNARKTEADFLIPVISELINSSIVPILIGEKSDQCLAQYLAYKNHQQLCNLAAVGKNIPLSVDPQAPKSYLNTIIEAPHPQLFNLSWLAYQSHFVAPEIVDQLRDQHFEDLRLGQIRTSMAEAEPLIRDADLLCFHLDALRASDTGGQTHPSPAGLFAEEACQLSRYAGMSDKLSSAGFYGYQAQKDSNTLGAQLMALLVWYFIDGFNERKNDFPVSTDGLTEYIVEFKKHDHRVTFWKSKRSGRWWMQIPVESEIDYQRHRLIPCSYQDYQQACRDDMSDRLMNAYKRFG